MASGSCSAIQRSLKAGQAGLGGLAVRARYADGAWRRRTPRRRATCACRSRAATASRVQPAGVVDQHRAVHLAAGAERGHARRRVLDPGQHLADRLDGAGPPVGRALLGPAELRHDLLVLAAGEGEDRAGPVDERGADAARPDVDGEIEVAHGLEPRIVPGRRNAPGSFRPSTSRPSPSRSCRPAAETSSSLNVQVSVRPLRSASRSRSTSAAPRRYRAPGRPEARAEPRGAADAPRSRPPGRPRGRGLRRPAPACVLREGRAILASRRLKPAGCGFRRHVERREGSGRSQGRAAASRGRARARDP